MSRTNLQRDPLPQPVDMSIGHPRVEVRNIRVGQRVDLDGDDFADPEGDRPEFVYEFAAVYEIEHEPHDTDPCIVLHTSLGSFGFPPDHLVAIDGEQPASELDPS